MSEQKNISRAQEVERELIAISRLDDGQLFEKYHTEAEGLNQVEAAERLGSFRHGAFQKSALPHSSP